ncbi:hypothetical protein BOTBODRAFT_62375 [Botryobasidium botryosum FD-172 SS1]|uniref:Glucose-methanol-choline oxidoreductase N-terminal domain-containing protein n=1 Tax=Botryobasidium botryosum (strain FD-172 SS1) TaxID=930990 RepID=A0A067N8A5_BOTB1|nr:hypothetical protein BOTBODRAFT_62375 [Botryobasidium botryosum FD-172 SS1]
MESRDTDPSALIAHLQDISGKTFDYVIAGGCTAALVLANRLTENPSVTVAVLEAGDPHLDALSILIPAQYGINFNNPGFDWAFKTTPQPYANNGTLPWARGKGLGGSSGINFSFYQRPPSHDFDAIERLGNPGWNWDQYLKYSKKAETFQPPTQDEITKYGYQPNPDRHGKNGPLHVAFPASLSACEGVFQQTLANAGIETQPDPNGGNMCGRWLGLTTLDLTSGYRSYSADAYFAPTATRKNLKVLTGALVTQLTFDETDTKEAKVNGVKFQYGNSTYVVHAGKEVILSAGTIKTPQILEFSGIGDPKILKPLGIDVRVDLPSVGANVQDHMYASVTVEIDQSDKWDTVDALRNDPKFAQEQLALYQSTHTGAYSTGLGSFAFLPLKRLNPDALTKMTASLTEKLNKLQNPALKEQWTLQLEALKSDSIPDCEITLFPGYLSPARSPSEAGKKYLSFLGRMNHPFSRGTIHITSKSPADQPALDPHVFEQSEDLDMILEMLKYIRKLTKADPLKGIVVKEISPGAEYVSDNQLREFIRGYSASVWHTAGSCSMLPKEKGGVVDTQLRVYGTKNLRVVDLSILPLHIMAPTQATVYAIAEKAADIIKGVAV